MLFSVKMEEQPAFQNPRKPTPWGNYLKEFLMLFLAISLGFFVENLREDVAERQQEKEYIQSYLEDLKTDSANLTQVIESFEKGNRRKDTIISMFQKLKAGYNDTVWRNFLVVRKFPDFIYTDRTMQQLKNAGGMRLITNRDAANGIISYDSEVKLLNVDVDYLSITMHDLDKVWMELVDEASIEECRITNTLTESGKDGKSFLLSQDKVRLGILNNTIRRFRYVSELVKDKEKKLLEHAILLKQLLQKEYKTLN